MYIFVIFNFVASIFILFILRRLSKIDTALEERTAKIMLQETEIYELDDLKPVTVDLLHYGVILADFENTATNLRVRIISYKDNKQSPNFYILEQRNAETTKLAPLDKGAFYEISNLSWDNESETDNGD